MTAEVAGAGRANRAGVAVNVTAPTGAPADNRLTQLPKPAADPATGAACPANTAADGLGPDDRGCAGQVEAAATPATAVNANTGATARVSRR